MENYKIYYITGSSFSGTLVFKYHLNGVLKAFELQDAELDDNQVNWLFHSGNFPYQETGIDNFRKSKKFAIRTENPDLSFDAFWNAYALKIGKKKMAETSWNKLSKTKKIEAYLGIKPYNNWLRRNNGISKAHASTYLNQNYYENDYSSAH